MPNFWANLVLGKKLTEKQLRDIEFPRAEIHIHVLYKCLQFGCVVGGLVGLLCGQYAVAIKKFPFRAMGNYAGKGNKIGFLFAIPPGGIISEYFYVQGKTPEEILETAYLNRIRQSDLMVNRVSTYGAISGASLIMAWNLFRKQRSGISVIFAGITGFTIGTLLSLPIAYNGEMIGPNAPMD